MLTHYKQLVDGDLLPRTLHLDGMLLPAFDFEPFDFPWFL